MQFYHLAKKINVLIERLDSEKKSGNGGDSRWITLSDGRRIFVGTGLDQDLSRLKPRVKPSRKKIEFKRKDGTVGVRFEYDKRWVDKASKYKFGRVSQLLKKKDVIEGALRGEMGGARLTYKKAASTALAIMLLSGMRVGGGKGEHGMSGGEPTYGLTTLKREHVSVGEGEVNFRFRGKSGVDRSVNVEDDEVADAVDKFLGSDRSDEDKDAVFVYQKKGKKKVLHRRDVSDRFKAFGKQFDVKDLRTMVAMETASDEALKILKEPVGEVPRTKKERKQKAKAIQNRIAEAVSKKLGNTPAVALSNYINPELIEHVLDKSGLGEKSESMSGETKRHYSVFQEIEKIQERPIDERFPILSELFGSEAILSWSGMVADDTLEDEDIDFESVDDITDA